MTDKDAFWFRHDSNASRDIKMMQIKHIYDFWGIGLYWGVIELLREQPGYKFKSDESSLQLASTLANCSDQVRFISFIKDCIRIGLFLESEGMFFSQSLIERMRKWESTKINGRLGGRSIKKPTQSQLKANSKPTIKLNGSIRREDIREEKKRKEDSIVMSLSERTHIFLNSLTSYEGEYGSEIIKNFGAYWTEPSTSGKKFRKELQKTWDTRRRLDTWIKNDYGKKKTTVSTSHLRQEEIKKWMYNGTLKSGNEMKALIDNGYANKQDFTESLA